MDLWFLQKHLLYAHIGMHSYAVLDNRLTIIAHLKYSNKALYIIFTLNRFLISKHGDKSWKIL